MFLEINTLLKNCEIIVLAQGYRQTALRTKLHYRYVTITLLRLIASL